MLKDKKEQLLKLKKDLEYRIRCKSYYEKIIELKNEIESNEDWKIVSKGYSCNTNSRNFQEEYVYYNLNLNKGIDIVINREYELAYLKYLKEKDYNRYSIPKIKK